MRFVVMLFFRTWIKEVVGMKNIPKGPAIFVSNHLSYYDFLVFGSLLNHYSVFVASKKVGESFLVGWFTKLSHVVYVDQERPGFTFFRDIIRHLEKGRSVIIYPEGTRSRTGKMFKPKEGFVKLAIKANVPIIPVAMKGTYEILPPDKHIPRLKRCKITIGQKIYISPENPMFKDISFIKKDVNKSFTLNNEDTQKIAFRIMDKIRLLADEEWDESALSVN
jgi:1-acyl-sn-glycerol-3-phosphate acyltransferase